MRSWVKRIIRHWRGAIASFWAIVFSVLSIITLGALVMASFFDDNAPLGKLSISAGLNLSLCALCWFLCFKYKDDLKNDSH